MRFLKWKDYMKKGEIWAEINNVQWVTNIVCIIVIFLVCEDKIYIFITANKEDLGLYSGILEDKEKLTIIVSKLTCNSVLFPKSF